MPRPDRYAIWATDPAAAITEPNLAKKEEGWIVEAPPHDYFNWWQNLAHRWIEYVGDLACDMLFSVWHPVDPPIGQFLVSVASSNSGVWMAVSDGNNDISTSPDRVHWTAIDTGVTLYLVYGVAHDQVSKWVIVGTVGANDARIHSSDDDGVTWIERYIEAGTGLEARAVAHNGALWVVCGLGDAGTITSSDGTTWTKRNTLNGVSVAWSAILDLWCVVGPSGVIHTAPANGVTWTSQVSGTIQDLNGVTVDALGRFVAVGNAGVAIRSTDGITWVPLTTGTTVALNAITHDDESGTLIAVGDARNSMGQILTSRDGGDTWIDRSSTARPNNLYGVHATGEACVITGPAGQIHINTTKG